MDKSSSEQQFRKCEGITFAVLNFWSRTPSGTRSHGRLAGWPADEIQVIFKFLNQACAWFLKITLVRMYVCVCVCVSAPEAMNN